MSYREHWLWVYWVTVSYRQRKYQKRKWRWVATKPDQVQTHSVSVCSELFRSVSYSLVSLQWLKAHHFRLVSAQGFPRCPPSVCCNSGQVGISHDAVEFVCERREAEKERERDERDVCKSATKKFALNSWNGVKGFLGFFTTCTVESTVWACVCGCFAISLRAFKKGLWNHKSAFNTITAISTWFRVLHKYL